MREQLNITLPSNMVPTYLVAVDRLPLTRNGKIDRKRLVADHPPETAPSGQVSRPPRDELEQRLLEIFQLAFRSDHVTVDSDFFALGGDSMLAIQIGMRANDAGLELSPADLFEHRSIAALAVAARARRAGASPANVPKRERPANPIELAPGELDAILEQVTGPER